MIAGGLDDTVRDRVRDQLMAVYGRWHCAEGSAHLPQAWLDILLEAMAQEVATVEEMVARSAFAFAERVSEWTREAGEALKGGMAADVMRHVLDTLTEQALVTPESANNYLRLVRHYFRDHRAMRGKLVMFPLRAALTGRMDGPCLGVVMSLLGQWRCRERLENGLHDAMER